ncbi:MAG: PadR family transcriptional regulator [Saprospiraceae bacterium]|nr:PadR family transcriptional regulator [Saprospiraceae bacterium]
MPDDSLGNFEELILLMVAAHAGKAYGVSILKDLDEEHGKQVNISAIHVTLRRLEKKGMVISHFGGITSDRGGRRKKYYEITAYGKKVLDAHYDLRIKLYQQIPKLSPGT